jgi:hypothetical protein
MQVRTSDIRYSGSAALTNIWSYLTNDTDRTTVLRLLALRNGFTAATAAINNALAFNTRVTADGGTLVSPLSCLKFYQQVNDKSLNLANLVALSAGAGIKVAAGRITKVYDMGGTSNDFNLWVGSGATQVTVKGYPMMAFDGASMYRDTNAPTYTYPFSWAGAAASVSASVMILSESDAALTTDASTQTGSVLTSRSSQMRNSGGGNMQVNTTGTTDYLGLANYQASTGGGSSALYQDNVSDGSLAGGQRAYTGHHLFLGGVLTAATPATRVFTTGNWAESIHLNAASAQNAQDLSEYLHQKYLGAR